MRPLLCLSVLLSFGASVACMASGLWNIPIGERMVEYPSEMYKPVMNLVRKLIVRSDGEEFEPRDFICSTYSLLGKVDHSYRSDPPLFHISTLLDLSRWFDYTPNAAAFYHMDHLHQWIEALPESFNEDGWICRGECAITVNAWHSVRIMLTAREIQQVYSKEFVKSDETVENVLMKMCGEGWKHGHSYVKFRDSDTFRLFWASTKVD